MKGSVLLLVPQIFISSQTKYFRCRSVHEGSVKHQNYFWIPLPEKLVSLSFLFPALPVSIFCAQTQTSLEKQVLYPFKVVPGASSTTTIIKEKTQSNTQSRQEWMVQGQLTPICSRRVRLHIPGCNCHPQLHLHSPRSLPPPSSIPTRKARKKQFCGKVEFLLVNCPGWICKRTRSSCPNHFPRVWYYKNLISFLFCWRDRLKVYFTGTPFQVSLSPRLH